MALHRAFLEDFRHVGGSLDDEGGEVFDVDAGVFVFEVELCRLLGHEVSNLFVVDFEVADADQVLAVSVTLNLRKDSFKCARHDSFKHWVLGDSTNCERLACAGLAVREDGPVVALDHILTDRERGLCKHAFLLRVPVVHRVEGKHFGHVLARLLDEHFSGLWEDFDRTKRLAIALTTHGRL
jgi:hypothetical protein